MKRPNNPPLGSIDKDIEMLRLRKELDPDAPDAVVIEPLKIEILALSIATNQFTVPLPTGKEVIQAVNSHAALVTALRDYQHRHDVLWHSAEIGRNSPCPCGACTKAAAALALATKP